MQFRPARPRDPPAPQPTPLDAFEEQVRTAQTELQTSIDRAALRNDPYGHVLTAMSSGLALFPELVRQVRAASAAPGQPIDQATMERIAKSVFARANEQLDIRDRVLLAIIGVVLLVAGVAIGHLWR
jgi:hypothetical protein